MTDKEKQDIINEVITAAVPEIVKLVTPEIEKQVKEQLSNNEPDSKQDNADSKIDYATLVKNALN